MSRRLLLLFAISLLCYYAQAQSQLVFLRDSLTFTNVSIDSNSQILTVTDSLQNQGGASFTGGIRFDAYINGGASFYLDTTYINSLDTAPNNNLQGIQLTVPIGNSHASFVNGPNTLVIWPTFRSQPFTDTLHVHIDVIRNVFLGIDEAPLAQMYLIGTGGNLNVHFGEAQNIVKQVSFYDLTGRMMYTGSEDQSHHIPVADWSTGVYICEIQTINGGRRAIKFVLQ